MDKLKMHTENKVDINIEKIGSLFPNTLTEKIKGYDENNKPIIEKAIDFDILKQELSKVIVEGREERYQMNWPGKKEAILTANAPINKTLRPCREESVDFDKTENLYIEGDNLEVLKLLQETYLNKVKMIYIDPPYNTGNDSIVYDDDFSMSSEEFSEASGQYDEDGNMNYDIRKNSESNGRFHTDWLNMMYPRLKLARDLLTEDGAIFISIDDNEVENLKKICNEIFGEKNYLNDIVVKMSEVSGNKMSHANKKFPKIKEHLLIYKKNEYIINPIKIKKDEWDSEYNKVFLNFSKEDRDKIRNIVNKAEANSSDIKKVDDILCRVEETSVNELLKKECISKRDSKEWLIKNSYRIFRTASSESVKKLVDLKRKENDNIFISVLSNKEKKLYIGKTNYQSDSKSPRVQVLFADDYLEYTLGDIWMDITTTGLEFEGGVDYKNGKKPLELINRIIRTCNDSNFIVLDFFSGSSTTAESIIRENMNDNGNRKFIMVQINERLDDLLKTSNGESKKAILQLIEFLDSISKPHYLSEVGKERIRRAGKKIKEENPDVADKLDIGFRVLKLDSSNMKDVYYNPDEYNQDMIERLESNIKEDRSNEDLLFQVMLDLGELLSSDIKEIDIQDKKVFNVGDGNIIACFDEDITNEVLTEIAKMQPLYAIFRDSSLSNDSVVTNFEQIFKTYSPNTITKVL